VARKNKSARKPLSAELIAQTALDLANRGGLADISFRNIATALGCEAMSLYHYYQSKAHLMDAMVARCIAGITFADKAMAWPLRLRAAAHEYRAMALRNPGFYPFMAVYRMNSAEGLALLNTLLEIFEDSGLDVEKRARHFRSFGYYLTGACLDETMGYAKGPSAASPVSNEVAAKDYPAIIQVGRFFGSAHHLATFEFGLNAVMAAMEHDAAVLHPR
jgi:AcrR family transcriptional regulator